MGYKATSIYEITKDIDEKKVFLPALQRKFVWTAKKIETLFDSIMRGYPIGTFLFWKLDSEIAKDYVFYEFLQDFDERYPYNRRKEGVFLQEKIIGVLDGQQRLSSMFIGFSGYHKSKKKKVWKSNPNAYPEKRLYLNLFDLPYSIESQTNRIILDENKDYPFEFLTDTEVNTKNGYFFKVGDALRWRKDNSCEEIYYQILKAYSCPILLNSFNENKVKILYAIETLKERLHNKNLISYFEIYENDLENILKIFVRVNSGGTVLSKTDLLFSTVVATWSDGRKKIEELIQDINKNNRFNFGHEFIMRACLYLTDLNVKYKVSSFKAENVEKIQKNWVSIEKAVKATIDLIMDYGYSSESLASKNALLPIIYHYYKGGKITSEDKQEMIKYLVHTTVKQVFGGSQESVLTDLRQAMREKDHCSDYKLKNKNFSFDSFKNIKLTGTKSLLVDANDIENILNKEYGATTFNILVLLNRDLRLQDINFSQDHLHPKSKFNKKDMIDVGVPNDKHQQFIELKDTLPNLQMMNRRWNSSKNCTTLSDWFYSQSETHQQEIQTRGAYPKNVSLEFADFLEFHEERKERLRKQLCKVLDLN